MEPPTLKLHKHACHHLVLVTWAGGVLMITVLLTLARASGVIPL